MWKWTDANDVQAILLDVDSLDDDYLSFDYHSEVPNAKILKVINEPFAFDVEYNEQTDCLEYSDITSLLIYIMKEYALESYSLIAISNSNLFIKEMIQNHIGTIFIGELQENVFKYTPDFTNQTFDKLSNILKQKNVGYSAEVFASGGAIKRKSLIQSKKNITLLNGDEKQIRLLLGGRYYPPGRAFYIDDPLSNLIRNFKQRYISVIDSYFDSVINFVNRNEEIDYLCYSPPKPKDFEEERFDRFASLKLPLSYKKGIELQNIIECTEDFSQKGNDLYNRREVVKGAYKVLVDVKDKHVVILDDVYSTGSTMEEIARTLYENGARQVTAILIAVNQMIQSTSLVYKHPRCKLCGGELRLRINKNDNSIFFGCVNYQDRKLHTLLNCKDGLQEIKLINKFEQIDIVDLDDIY
ncbi:ComF family protein [Amedibacillus sp. YH-ame6]